MRRPIFGKLDLTSADHNKSLVASPLLTLLTSLTGNIGRRRWLTKKIDTLVKMAIQADLNQDTGLYASTMKKLGWLEALNRILKSMLIGSSIHGGLSLALGTSLCASGTSIDVNMQRMFRWLDKVRDEMPVEERPQIMIEAQERLKKYWGDFVEESKKG